MENKTNKKVIRVERNNNTPFDPNKKVVRKVVKIIDEKDLKNTNLDKEIKNQKEKLHQEELKKQEAEKRKKEAQEKERLRAIEEKKKLQQEAKKREEKIKKQKEKQKRLEKKELKKQQKQMAKDVKKAEKNKLKNENKNIPLKSKVFRIFKIAFISGFVTFLAGCSVLFLILYSWCQDIPDINTNELKQTALTSYIYDINGDLITTYSSSENREWVELEDMPDELVQAFVNVEDKRFYSHSGIDAKRFLGAVLGQITGSGDYGGSTITQQLIKNVYLTNEVTYKRKAQEIVLAYKLEKEMSKDEILEAYLNIIYFGSSNYGVAAAAEDYFGKDLDELSLREMAMLAGIPKNPNGYNPRTNTYVKQDMSKTNERTDTVLWVMKENGVINEEQYEQAINDTVEIKESSSYFEMYDYAHAVEYAMSDVVDDILEQRGLENTYENRVSIDNEIRKGGYSIYTTIDPDIQNSVQDTVENWDDYPYILDSKGNAIENESGYEKPQVASVVIDPQTGHILAMVGSRDTIDSMKTFNRAINSNMPIASTIKPLSIYAPCLEEGLNPASIEYNYKTYIEGYDKNSPYPGGESPEKPVTMREAVENSYNIAAARFLCNNIGYDKSEDYLLQLGIDKDSIQKNGSGLALGTSGINMLELTSAYQSFANGGWYYEPKAYTKVVDKNGDVILDSNDYQIKRQVFSEDTAWLMTDILSSTVTSGTAYNATIDNVDTAGKTGTHEDKCAVFAGYTGEYVSSIWVGSDSFSSMSDASGGRIATPIWQEYMSKIYEIKGVNKEHIYDEKPNTIKEVSLCALSGKLATDNCAETITDYVSTNNNLENCDLHVSINVCSYSGKLQGEDCPEYAIKEKNVLFVPLTSNLSSIPEEIIHKYYPDAIIESEDSICNSHKNGITIPNEEQIGYARNLLKKIDKLKNDYVLEQQNLDILNNDYESISQWISRAENALYNSAEESSSFYSDYFTEYNRVKQDIANIQSSVQN